VCVYVHAHSLHLLLRGLCMCPHALMCSCPHAIAGGHARTCTCTHACIRQCSRMQPTPPHASADNTHAATAPTLLLLPASVRCFPPCEHASLQASMHPAMRACMHQPKLLTSPDSVRCTPPPSCWSALSTASMPVVGMSPSNIIPACADWRWLSFGSMV